VETVLQTDACLSIANNSPSINKDDYSRTPVSSNFRPWWYFLTIELGALISVPVFFIGGKLGLALTLPNLVAATFIGGLILSVIGSLTGRLGTTTRCSTALIARSTFGSYGAAFISLFLALGMTGWWAVQTEMFSEAAIKLIQTLFNISIAREFMIAIGGCAMITTAALGIRVIGRLAYITAPLLFAGLLYALYSFLINNGWQKAIVYQPDLHNAIGLGSAIAIVISVCIAGSAVNPDFTRFAIDTRHAIGYIISILLISYPLVLIFCGILAIGFGSQDLFIHLAPTNCRWLILLLMIFATWAVNDCNLYSSSLGLTAVIPTLKRSILAIAAGSFGIFLAEFRLAEHMMSFLTLIGILIAPISGVFIAGAVEPRNILDQTKIASVPYWRIGPLIAWLAGAVIGFFTTPKQDLGLGLFSLTTIPALDSLLAATIFMLLINLYRKATDLNKQHIKA
jgi:cytosine permease